MPFFAVTTCLARLQAVWYLYGAAWRRRALMPSLCVDPSTESGRDQTLRNRKPAHLFLRPPASFVLKKAQCGGANKRSLNDRPV